MRIAVVAHQDKTLGDGLVGLRERLAARGIADPSWYEVPKSRKAPKAVRRAISDGAEVVLVWGGDGMVQRSIDAAVGHDVVLGILPAGTSNLLATNLGIVRDLDAALDVALDGHTVTLDLGSINDEHFAVMAGCGFDAMVMRDTDKALKSLVGRVAYVWSGARNLDLDAVAMRVRVDGRDWFDGEASCVLVGNVGEIFGGIEVFGDARPDDGVLEVGVVTAATAWEWLRTLGRTAVGDPARSPFVRTTRGRRVDVRLARPMPFELDGGDRPASKRLRIRVRPGAVRLRVPVATAVVDLRDESHRLAGTSR